MKTILVHELQTSRAEAGRDQLGFSVLQEKVELYKDRRTGSCFVFILEVSTQSFIQSKSNSAVAQDKKLLMVMAVMIDGPKPLRYLVIFFILSKS